MKMTKRLGGGRLGGVIVQQVMGLLWSMGTRVQTPRTTSTPGGCGGLAPSTLQVRPHKFRVLWVQWETLPPINKVDSNWRHLILTSGLHIHAYERGRQTDRQTDISDPPRNINVWWRATSTLKNYTCWVPSSGFKNNSLYKHTYLNNFNTFTLKYLQIVCNGFKKHDPKLYMQHAELCKKCSKKN